MKHYVRAIIGVHKVIQQIENSFLYAKEINLPQGYGMIFLTDALLDDIAELFESANEPSTPDAVTSFLLQDYSFHAKLAYIEIDYSSGIGTQSGILYENGKIRIPSCSGEGTINILLRELGVWCEVNKDEFDSLNLGIYRRMDKWIKSI